MQAEASPGPGSLEMTAAALTHRGRLRTTNEDSHLLQPPLLVVADGLGGLAAGEVASRLLVEFIAASLPQPPASDSLSELLRLAGERVREAADADAALAGMATTCTLLLLVEDRAEIAHVGDTRAYLLRGDDLQQLTRDHSVAQDLVRIGRISADEAATHPARNTLTRALGGGEAVEVDRVSQALADGDRLLLCSDGLSGAVRNEHLGRILGGGSVDHAAQRLVDAALAAGGVDDVTVIVADIRGPRDDASQTPPPSP
jgi:PPM family protein phosphatase